MRILITGAKGQLGNEINALSGDFPQFQIILTDVDELDITNRDSVVDFIMEQNPDFLVNCAAYTAVDKAEDEPEKAKLINAVAPGILAEVCMENDIKLIHTSTDYVFDGTNHKPYIESDEVNPIGIYGKTKLQGELNCSFKNPESVIIRTSWLYSVFGNNFVKTILRLGKEKDILTVISDQVGTPTNAADLAKSILNIIEGVQKKKIFVPGIYHYSNEGVCSWYDFALAIVEMANMNCKVVPIKTEDYKSKAKRPHYSVLNKTKIKTTYQLEIPYWRDSLKSCIESIINN
ncbi:MAG: dTDP-4-dehydrorhamnose reductase [Prolixibacteraceae bacterium]|nr:dTDP-4-dehydrorhamnose reductase [Prolixibacteraceae bacterium]MBN2775579.1 dTDP-4-dehydrorhamnose reductase [Prolixibacteraceae bacterium]